MSENLITLFDFANAVKESLQEKYPTAKITINKVIKNNDECLLGITITEHESNIAPNIYINDYYDAYMNEKITVDEVAVSVQKVYNTACKSNDLLNLDTSCFTDRDKLLGKVIIKLFGKEFNEEFLKDAVYETVLDDLAAVIYVYIDSNERGLMTSKLQPKHLEKLGIDEEELFEAALKNTANLFPAKICNMSEIVVGMGKDALPCDDFPMYVATNSNSINGAAVCLYPGLFKKFSEEHNLGNLYILPSSVSEIIILPESIGSDVDYLKEMVEDVNASVLVDKDILSNSLYRYDYETDTVSKIK